MKSVIAVPFARRLSGRTNYRKRLPLLKASLPRIVVRKTLTSIIMQIVEFDPKGDAVRLTATSSMLRKLGWRHSGKNIPASYLCGMLVGKMALAKKIESVVPDIGLHGVTKGGKIFAALKGAKDAGLGLSVSDDVVPDAGAISGAKIAAYSKAASGSHQFAKVKAEAAKITDDFEKVKAAIAAGNWQSSKKGSK